MKKAVVIYHSKTGITKRFGEEISNFLSKNKIDSKVVSIQDYNPDDLKNVDYLLLGCWTSGLMIFLQHPDKIWIKFAQQLPDLNGKKIALFTTYKLAIGSMFLKMKKHIHCSQDSIIVEMKSRNGYLTEPAITELKKLIN